LLRSITFGLFVGMLSALGGCAPDYSPNTYASTAVQQANKVEPGVVVGFREVAISASGTVGAVTGGAAGGVLGSQVGSSNVSAALGTVGGGIVGSIVGTTLEHTTGDTTGWEYIIRKPNGELLSVTQREDKPIPLGQKVLVITGGQARIIADYSLPADPTPAAKETPEPKTKHVVKESAEPKDKGEPTPQAPVAAAPVTAPAADQTYPVLPAPQTPASPTPAPLAAPTVTPAPEAAAADHPSGAAPSTPSALPPPQAIEAPAMPTPPPTESAAPVPAAAPADAPSPGAKP
jgi:outer membrane lipoprotein SlyB